MRSVAVSFNPFASSVFRKQILAASGLMIAGFLVIHLAGNLLLFRGPEVYNRYAFVMLSHPLIMVLEWLLALVFAGHALLGLKIIADNRKARPVPYVVRSVPQRRGNFSLISMSVTGPAILLFLLIHIFDFRFASLSTVLYEEVVMRDLYSAVVSTYQSPVTVTGYIFAMLLVGLHLHHGFWSAFQSFGFWHERYNRFIELTADFLSLTFVIGFVFIPLWFFLQGIVRS
ncbi:MAG: succinate dehydrogenase cytochrome b subunit [Pseudomonadales bacterium]|nr:succinate dehydrogenase cytochrome b subunit [Pseudomonadales bacterium]